MREGIAHIPSLQISNDLPLQGGEDQLVKIPFNEWYAMDQTFTWAESKYGRSDPVFFKFTIPDGMVGPEKEREYCLEKITRFYRALVLTSGHYYFPHPEFSCMYVRRREQENAHVACTRYVGPFNREWIVFGSVWNNPYDQVMLDELERLYSVFENPAISKIEDQYGGFGLFEEVSEPEFLLREIIPGNGATFDSANSFVRAIAWIENVLLNERRGAMKSLSITKALGVGMGCLLAKKYDDLETYIPYFSSLYKLRSRLVHGETHWNSLSANDQENCRLGIFFMAMVYRKIIAYHLGPGKESSISKRLNSLVEPANGSNVSRDEFDQLFGEVNSVL